MERQAESTTNTPKSLINEVHISGRVVTEPQRYGKGPFKFRLAHGGGGKRKDGSTWPVQFFSCTCWSDTVMEGVVRSAKVEVFGKLRDASYTAKDGTQRAAVEIVADAVLVAEKQATITSNLESKLGGTATAKAILSPGTKPNAHGAEVSDADIRF